MIPNKQITATPSNRGRATTNANSQMTPPPLPTSSTGVVSRNSTPTNSRVSLVCIVLVMGLYFASIFNWLAPVGVRFAPGPLNSAVLFVALLLPCAAIALLVGRHRGAVQTAGIVLVGLFAVPSLLL